MFYTFRQNSSGGSFVRNNKVDVFVVIEGDSMPQVEARALAAGIYFDGCANEIDCDCCGDRWQRPWNGAAMDEVPVTYGEPVENISATRSKDSNVVIHYLNGTVAYARY